MKKLIPEITFWERGEDGEVLPQQLMVDVNSVFWDDAIMNYEDLLFKTDNKKQKVIYEKTINRLKEEKEKDKNELKIVFVPLKNFELRNIVKPKINGMSIGVNGLPVQDLDANICSTHCLEPKHSYNDWLCTKNPNLKLVIARKIYDNSFPPVSDFELETKKKIVRLVSLRS